MESPSGRAVLFLLKSAKLQQPLAIFLENVEGIRSHPHMGILKRFIAWAGYRMVWCQSSCLSDVSHCIRRRWVAVLIRQDLLPDASASHGVFKLGGQDVVCWADPVHQWNIPESMRNQLAIDENLWPSYACRELLPAQKQSRVGSDSPVDVLRARVPDANEPLATLVANYGVQHLLSSQQIRSRGIFAEILEVENEKFEFFHPVLKASLLGCTQSLYFPDDALVALAHVGNAISIPQAALTVRIGLQSLQLCNNETSIKGMVVKLWNQRLTAQNSVCVEVQSGYALFTLNDYLLLGGVLRCPLSTNDEEFCMSITWPDQVVTNVTFSHGDRVGDVLVKMQFQQTVVQSWGLWIESDASFKCATSRLPPHDFSCILAYARDSNSHSDTISTVVDSAEELGSGEVGVWEPTAPMVDEDKLMISFFVRLIEGDAMMVAMHPTSSFITGP